MSQLNAMPGPDFLEAIAEQESARSNDINAATFHERALQWKADLLQLERAIAEVDRLTQCLGAIAKQATPPPARSHVTSQPHHPR